MQERHLPSLGQEDALEKEMATYSSILAWEISWTEELGGLQSTELQGVPHNSKKTTDLLKGNLFRENLPAVWLSERMLNFKWIFFAQVSFLSGVQAATDQNSAMQPASKKDLLV